MAIARSGVLVEKIDGTDYPLRLRNAEIERFEDQFDFGIFELWDQIMGRGRPPKAGHVRDLVALALVGAGMSDLAADKLIASLGPDHNFALRAVAQRVLGAAFFPIVLRDKGKKKQGGSPPAEPSASPDGTHATASEISAG